MRWFRSNKDTSTDRSPGQSIKLPDIIASNIKAVTDLDGAHYVFLLTFNTGEQVVLKAESGVSTTNRAKSHDLGVKIMGVVSAVKAKALTEAEKMQVGLIDTGISRDFFRAEQVVRSGNYNWVKAAFQSGLAGLKGVAQFVDTVNGFGVDNPIKKAEAKATMIKMNKDLKGNTKAWESLGGIIAADMLIANSDRINLHYGQIVNLGNVQFRRSGKKIVEAVGLDTFDPAQAGRAGDMFSTNIQEWQNEFGIYLKDLTQAKTQLFACMESGKAEIDQLYGAGTCEWGKKESNALYSGYVKGIEKLKAKMKLQGPKLMKQGSAAPKGLMLKLNWLGWL
jgi:hypothetical protein